MKHLKPFLLFLLGAIAITACQKDEPEAPSLPALPYDALVLHEGNYYNGIMGSLATIGFKSQTLTDGVFAAANKRQLGATPNDMVVADGKVFIAVTDENRVEVADAVTFLSLATITMPQPRCLCVTQNGVAVSCYDGCVRLVSFDLKSVKQSQKVGACLEGIAERSGRLYVCNAYNPDYSYNANVLILNASTLAAAGEVSVVVNPTEIVSHGSDLYLLSSGNYADVPSQLQRIDASDRVTAICPATLFCTDGSSLLVANTVTDWSDYTSTTEFSAVDMATLRKRDLLTAEAAAAVFSPSAMAAGADGSLFIASYNRGSWGTADFSAPGYIVSFDSRGNQTARYEAGVGVKKIEFVN